MSKKHKLHYNRCVYNILGSSPNSRIGIKKISIPNTITYKPVTRVRTKPMRMNGTGRRFN